MFENIELRAQGARFKVQTKVVLNGQAFDYDMLSLPNDRFP